MTDQIEHGLLDRTHVNGQTRSASSIFQRERETDIEGLALDTKYVVPFLWGAIFTGAILGYFWKRK